MVAVASLPVVFFVAVLPISVQGIGTTQAAMVFFFARYGTGDQTAREAAVLADSLVTQVIALGFQSLLGLACLRSRIGRDLRNATRPPRAPAADPSERRPSFDGGAPRQVRKGRWRPATSSRAPSTASRSAWSLLARRAWMGVSAWPLVALNANVKNELNDALPRAYRANLLTEPGATARPRASARRARWPRSARWGSTTQAAVRSRAARRRSSIEVRYHAHWCSCRGCSKSYPFPLHPRVETDAARVEW